MYFLTEPGHAQIQAFMAAQSRLPFSYPQVGATHLPVQRVPAYLPKDTVVDHNRIRLGRGAPAFARAKAALDGWSMFHLDWIKLFLSPPGIAENTVVAILAHSFGIWSLNAARIIYILDESAEVERYGFAYGTLPDHAKRGEERFAVEWHHHDNSVWYDRLAFSGPSQLLSRLGHPYIRGLQYRFAADSLRAMRRAVA